jgi:hypothetical protein
LTVRRLVVEWVLILMDVTQEKWGCSCVSSVCRPIHFRLHNHCRTVQVDLLDHSLTRNHFSFFSSIHSPFSKEIL